MTSSHKPQLTVRLLMQGKEVGSIIGKKGDHIKSMRTISGAHINVSDGATPERIVTLTGNLESLSRAFAMICKKFEEDFQSYMQQSQSHLVIRIIVPAVQCGSIIGKSGCKIKSLRESTNASIQIGGELLPNSTERAVTISGNAVDLNACFIEICKILIECPIKADPIPYRPFIPTAPTTASSPVFLINGQAFQIHGNYVVPLQTQELIEVVNCSPMNPFSNAHMQSALQTGSSFPLQDATLPNKSIQTPFNQQSKQITIANDLIGCIIGRGGQKISEIRQVSGANIKIADLVEGSTERKITITGTYEQINLAEALIQSRIASEIGGIILTAQ